MKRFASFFIIVISMIGFMFPCFGSNVFEPKPVVTVKNFTVTVTEAESIKDMRYAPGDGYKLPADIKAAEGNVAISNALIKKYTTEGVFVYEMPRGGIYTLWVRMNDGTNYLYSLDVTVIEPYVSSYGVKITAHNLFDVKDIFIAKGAYNSYKEIKENGYIFWVGAAKIGSNHEYSYTVYEPGMHTVLIRYNNGTLRIFHENLVTEEPVFTENGLQLVVSNIPDVKVIRTAYGKYNSTKELKTSDTIRNFSAKSAIKGSDPYTIQYRNEGLVTVIVEYNNGYVKVYHYEVYKKQPEVEIMDDGVKFSNLEGLTLIRYAQGEYETAAEIKGASGSTVIKSSAITEGSIYVSPLTKGMKYTFCVQYNDESYNFYVITVKDKQIERGSFCKHFSYNDSQGNNIDTLPYWLHIPADTSAPMPLIVVLHSAHGKINDSLSAQENLDNMVKHDLTAYLYNGEFGNIPAYVIMPQTNTASRGWAKRGEEITELVEYCKREYNIDSNAISIMGYSLGGTGAIEIASQHPEVFNSVLSVAGGLDGVTNNTIPFIDGSRYNLKNTYPDLRVMRSDGIRYEPEMIKYLYAEFGSRFKVSTDAEIEAALRFKQERFDSIASALRGESVKLWMIVGSADEEVEPSVSEDLCCFIGSDLVTCDVFEGYSHTDVSYACLEMRDEIMEFVLH